MKKFYDYDIVGECEYEDDCSEPVDYEVTFYDENSVYMEVLLLCEKHFYKVIEGLEEV